MNTECHHSFSHFTSVTAEDPLIANVVRMLITVHRQLDLFEAVGIDTFFEVGLVSVEPTHTGKGENTSYE
jgi:hypothetical protein